MKKTYLKPEVLSVDIVVETMIAQSNGNVSGDGVGSGGTGGQRPKSASQGDWDNIWSNGGSN